MSLLMNYNDPRMLEAAQKIFEEQFKRDPKLQQEMDDRRKQLMYDDVVYNLSFLLTAVYFDDHKIFDGYSIWIYELLCNLMKDLDRDRVMKQMVHHYEIMAEIIENDLTDLLNKQEIKVSIKLLKSASKAIEESVTNIELSSSFLEGEFTDLRKAYLEALLTSNTKLAHKIILDTKKDNVSLLDIYEEILAKTMTEIGELWHKNVITVDREHYATSVTQTVMSSFYEEIFDQPKNNLTLLSCAVGSELHELGIRMLADVFEYHGWNTYYLGAALPLKSILNAIEEHKPDLVALSVTMAPYLKTCEDIVHAIREKHPNVKIAVGGRAFVSTQKLWEKWDIDTYSDSTSGLLLWANKTFNARKTS